MHPTKMLDNAELRKRLRSLQLHEPQRNSRQEATRRKSAHHSVIVRSINVENKTISTSAPALHTIEHAYDTASERRKSDANRNRAQSVPNPANPVQKIMTICIERPQTQPQTLESLKVAIPKNDSKFIGLDKHHVARPSPCTPTSPFLLSGGSILNPPPAPRMGKKLRRGSVSKKPVHLWKSRHVARWVKKICPECVKEIVENKVDGARLLMVEKESDLVELGFETSQSRLGLLLRDLQRLQTEDLAWRISKSV